MKKTDDQSEVGVDVLVMHGCFADGITGGECVFDGCDGMAVIDCTNAAILHSQGKGRDDCKEWRKFKKCAHCGSYISLHNANAEPPGDSPGRIEQRVIFFMSFKFLNFRRLIWKNTKCIAPDAVCIVFLLLSVK